jgi:hypothetical protein
MIASYISLTGKDFEMHKRRYRYYHQRRILKQQAYTRAAGHVELKVCTCDFLGHAPPFSKEIARMQGVHACVVYMQ